MLVIWLIGQPPRVCAWCRV